MLSSRWPWDVRSRSASRCLRTITIVAAGRTALRHPTFHSANIGAGNDNWRKGANRNRLPKPAAGARRRGDRPSNSPGQGVALTVAPDTGLPPHAAARPNCQRRSSSGCGLINQWVMRIGAPSTLTATGVAGARFNAATANAKCSTQPKRFSPARARRHRSQVEKDLADEPTSSAPGKAAVFFRRAGFSFRSPFAPVWVQCSV